MRSVSKRFWSTVSIEAAPESMAWLVLLDNRPITLPSGTRLCVASRSLAEAIALEWTSIPEAAVYTPDELPLTQLVATQFERIGPERAEIIKRLVGYGRSDSLCYRACGKLGGRLDTLFAPVLNAFADQHGVKPAVTEGVMPLPPAPDLERIFLALLTGLTDAQLTCISVCVQATGSLVLALGLLEGWVQLEQAYDILAAEQQFHMAKWGEDPTTLQEIHQQKRDVAIAMHFLGLSEK